MTGRVIEKARRTPRSNKLRRSGLRRAIISLIAISGALAMSLFLSEDIGAYALEGLRLATLRVLPSALPFMITSGFFASMIRPEALPTLSKITERIFAVPASAFPALVIGNITGFPIGGKITSELYAASRLQRDDAERLLAYSSNPSPAFIVGAVGVGLLGDKRLGVLLLISLISGTVISAQLFRYKMNKSQNTVVITEQKYDFVASVKSSADASVSMIAFITIFYTGAKLIISVLGATPLSTAIILLSEVTGAVAYVSSDPGFSLLMRMGLSAFALGFGGISVMLQTAVFSKKVGLSLKRYLEIKAVEGVFSALAAMLSTYLYLLYTA